jgi:hypothetical protein
MEVQDSWRRFPNESAGFESKLYYSVDNSVSHLTVGLGVTELASCLLPETTMFRATND